MNNRQRLICKLMKDDANVVKTKAGERLFLIEIIDGKFFILGCLKKSARKTPSFRKGKKHYGK